MNDDIDDDGNDFNANDKAKKSDGKNIEEKALEHGWVPKDEYRGRPEDWCDADEFLRRGDPRYLREQLVRTEREVRTLKQQSDAEKRAFEARLQRMEKMSAAQRTKLYADIEQARRAAVELGDTQEYDRLNKAEAELYRREQEAAAVSTKETATANDVHPDVERWVQSNPWFLKDKALNMAAQGIHVELLEQEPGLSVKENLDRVKEELKSRFPEKFASKRSSDNGGRTAVEGGGRMSSTTRGKGWTDIPSEERAIIDRHVKEGLYKDRAEAAKIYWSE